MGAKDDKFARNVVRNLFQIREDSLASFLSRDAGRSAKRSSPNIFWLIYFGVSGARCPVSPVSDIRYLPVSSVSSVPDPN